MIVNVYLIDINQLDEGEVPTSWDDNTFVNVAECQGLVYSLEGFQNAFNNDEIDTYNCYIRFVKHFTKYAECT